MTSPSTAVATTDPLAALRAQSIAEIKQRNAHAAVLRGQQWSKESSPEMVRAVAHYCSMNNLDPARHVEVLGNRIYLTGELYEERGAPMVLSGAVTVDEPQFVHADARLEAHMASADPAVAAWAKEEHIRRVQARIQYGIPDDATGACVIRMHIGRTTLIGANWCGGASKTKRRKFPKAGEAAEYRSDPVGDAEPTKTAQSRAKRRAWRQIVVALPEYAATMGTLEVSAHLANADLAVLVSDERVTMKELTRLPNPGLMGGATYGEHTPGEPVPAIDEAERLRQIEDERTPEDEEFELSLSREALR